MLYMNKTLLSTIIATCLTMTNQAEAQNSNSFIGRQTPTINERTFTPEALWAMGRIGGYDIAPDAKSAVYNVSYYSVEQNKSHTVIYTINTDGSGEKLLTTSNGSEVAPKYIANGSQIAFLAADNNGTMQIWTMNPNGTERKQISNLPNDVDDFQFSPDGKMVLVIHTVKFGKRAADVHPDLNKTTGRVLNNAMYRHWDEWVEEIPHPFLADFNGSSVENAVDIMSDEPFECPMKPFGAAETFAWSPDSKKLVYTSRKVTGKDYAFSTNSDLYLYDLEAKTTVNLTEGMLGYDTNPHFSPDGNTLAWADREKLSLEQRNTPYVYGLTLANYNQRYEGGSSIQIDFDKTFGKKIINFISLHIKKLILQRGASTVKY